MVPDDSLYPPPPPDVPRDLARPGLRYRLAVALVLAALLLFLLFYVALMAGSLFVLFWALFPPEELRARLAESTAANIALGVARFGLCAAAGMFFAFLLKGFFTKQPDDTENYLEVTETEQTELFAFLRRLCGEIGCAMPARVYLDHQVNAGVFFSTSIGSLFVEPPKNLLIGLGMVAPLDLVGFKSVLAHEFGHFSQRTLRLSNYVRRLYRVLYNMVHVRDRWDAWMVRAFDTPVLSAFLVPLYMLVEWTRKLLAWFFRVLDPAYRGLSWQMEFNADLVAVGAAGTDAFIRVERESAVAAAAQQQAAQELGLAAEHRRNSRDLFFHQTRAAETVRSTVTEAPALPASPSHPSSHDRERNAQRRVIASPVDDRPAWLLFRNAGALREEVTRGFYYVCFGLEPEELEDPEQVQAFIDEERAAAAIPERYRGAYDDRYLEVADLDEVLAEARRTIPPPPGPRAQALRDLYSDEVNARAVSRRGREAERRLLADYGEGRQAGKTLTYRGREYPVAEAVNLLSRLEAEAQDDREYLVRFDRSVFTQHYHLAEELGRGEDYYQRYRFHVELQVVLRLAWEARFRLQSVVQFLYSGQTLHVDQLGGLLTQLGEVAEILAAAYQRAEPQCLPPLKHLPAGEPLLSHLPPAPDTSALSASDTALSGATLSGLEHHLVTLTDRLNRLWLKSLNGILAMQDDLAREWSARLEPSGTAPTTG
jgi:hypothetical protein